MPDKRFKGFVKDEGDFYPWTLYDMASSDDEPLAKGYHGTAELARRDMRATMESRGLPLDELEIEEG